MFFILFSVIPDWLQLSSLLEDIYSKVNQEPKCELSPSSTFTTCPPVSPRQECVLPPSIEANLQEVVDQIQVIHDAQSDLLSSEEFRQHREGSEASIHHLRSLHDQSMSTLEAIQAEIQNSTSLLVHEVRQAVIQKIEVISEDIHSLRDQFNTSCHKAMGSDKKLDLQHEELFQSLYAKQEEVLTNITNEVSQLANLMSEMQSSIIQLAVIRSEV